MRKQGKKRWNYMNILLAGLFTMVIIVGIGLFIKYCVPTGKKYDLNTYFETSEGADSLPVVLDGEVTAGVAKVINGDVFLTREYVVNNLNPRFYADSESGAILYTTDSQTTTYTDGSGHVSKQGDVWYINLDTVLKVTNMSWEKAEAPDRIVVSKDRSERTMVTLKKKAAIRYRAGIKSPILKKTKFDAEAVIRLEEQGAFTKVLTADGITGYVKTKEIIDSYSEKPADTYVEKYQKKSMNQKFTIGWVQTTNLTSNVHVKEYADQATGLNVVSPTWYRVEDITGEVTSYADASVVSAMHAEGIQVWPLINDFATDLDVKTLLSSQGSRSRIISRLMKDAASYGYDGINLDFEYVKEASAEDYLQFIRELSVECQKRNLYLSVDNYVPRAFRAYYNYKEQASYADYLIMMTYDEHYSGSDAGSTSSIGFVRESVANALAMVDKSQLICALPFYTRLWETKDGKLKSTAFVMTSALAKVEEANAEKVWNDELSQYTAEWDEDGAHYQIWLEEEKSFAEKMKVVREADLPGVAVWKLGGEKQEIWSVINTALGRS